MTTSAEWSIAFDLLYNNISSNQAPGLTDYEKSIFLTQAQEAVILDIYKGTAGDAFETTEEVTRYLSSLVTSKTHTQLTEEPFMFNTNCYKIAIDDTQVWFITYQAGSILVNNIDRDVIIVPTKQDFLYNDLKNPFRGPNENRVLSLSEDENIILYSKYNISKFYFKYLKRPSAIDLEATEFSVDIPESLHNQVLIRAVQIAKAVWQS